MKKSEPTKHPMLPMFEVAPGDRNVRWLEDLLMGAKCWMTAKDIMLTAGGRVLDREIRSLASASEKIISGQLGYKNIAHATASEIDHAANWLESQAKKMSERACSIRRQAHKIVG